MKETYNVKTPRKIVFGDPCYFNQYSGKKLKSLVVDMNLPRDFDAKVVLEETPLEKDSDTILRTMAIYAAPKMTMDTYLEGMKYKYQDNMFKEIGVDTAEYYLRVDDSDDIIRTSGDGCWGDCIELSHRIEGKRILDAVIITVIMPEDETMETMRQRMRYFFENVTPTKNVEPANKSQIETQDANISPQNI